MSRRWLAAVVLLVLPLAPVLPAEGAEEGRALFNGKDLDGWVVEGAKDYKDGDKVKPVWVARDGMISCTVNRGSYGFLRYARQEFADFHLHLEYRMAPPAGAKGRRGNSGVGIRTVPFDPKRSGKTRPSAAAYEVQLLDDAGRPPDKHSTGSLYTHVAPKVNAAKAAPAWNVLEIECVGPRIKITLNGQEVVDVDQSTLPAIRGKPLRGYICLQNHGSPVDFRNVRVREIKAKK
jgi:hypothetical protein